MLAKPDIPDKTILDCLENDFGWRIAEIAFLPLGADQNTAVYRARPHDGMQYFVKLRLGDFNAASVLVPHYLSRQGIQQIIPPQATRGGQLWAALDTCRVIVYPFVDGQTGYEEGMSAAHWHGLGAAMRRVHALSIPGHLAGAIPRADFAPPWPARMQQLLAPRENAQFSDPTSHALASFLHEQEAELRSLIAMTQQLAAQLQANPPDFVLCHGDLHGWNLLIDKHNQLFIIDWDTLIFAPKERDLMFIGSGVSDSGYSAEEEELLFYGGYGKVPVHHIALAYYRFARVLEDIVLFAEQILTTDSGGSTEDRQQALHYLQSNFLPASTIAQAYRALYRWQPCG